MSTATRTAASAGCALAEHEWRALRVRHEAAEDSLVAGHLDRRRTGVRHPVEDSLFTYYTHRPAQLRRWHPGDGVALAGDPPHARWRGSPTASSPTRPTRSTRSAPPATRRRHLSSRVAHTPRWTSTSGHTGSPHCRPRSWSSTASGVSSTPSTDISPGPELRVVTAPRDRRLPPEVRRDGTAGVSADDGATMTGLVSSRHGGRRLVARVDERIDVDLYLMQHGVAAAETQDPARPLTDLGRDAVERVTARARAAGVHVDACVHSGKLRAEQTAQVLASGLRIPTVEARDDLGPSTPVPPFARWLGEQDGHASLAVVGHLPFLDRLASLLVGGQESTQVVRFRNAGLVKLVPKQDAVGFTVDWVLVPDLA